MDRKGDLISMDFPFRMLIIVFVSEMCFGYEHYVDCFVKRQESNLKFMLADAVSIPEAYFQLVHLVLTRTCKIWI